MESPTNLFQAFANSYYKALDLIDSEKHELARTQYLLMLDYYTRILDHNFQESIVELMHEQLMKVYGELNN